MQVNRKNTSTLANKRPSTCCPAANHQDSANLALKTRKTSGFFMAPAQAFTLVPEIMFLT